MITIIAACSKNRVIGANNQLLWHLPEDLKRFKNITLGYPVVMGRKTYESIGKSLPGRLNIVLTKDRNYVAENCLVYNNIWEVLDLYEKSNLFVIGGGQIYYDFLPFAKKIELTLIDKDFEGDTFFPILDNSWEEVKRIDSNSGDLNFSFLTFLKK